MGGRLDVLLLGRTRPRLPKDPPAYGVDRRPLRHTVVARALREPWKVLCVPVVREPRHKPRLILAALAPAALTDDDLTVRKYMGRFVAYRHVPRILSLSHPMTYGP
jgi:hypothetical protein